jgi:hypothetical protein
MFISLLQEMNRFFSGSRESETIAENSNYNYADFGKSRKLIKVFPIIFVRIQFLVLSRAQRRICFFFLLYSWIYFLIIFGGIIIILYISVFGFVVVCNRRKERKLVLCERAQRREREKTQWKNAITVNREKYSSVFSINYLLSTIILLRWE